MEDKTPVKERPSENRIREAYGKDGIHDLVLQGVLEECGHEVLVAIWPGHDLLDVAIRFLTHGTGTHAAFVRGNGMIVETSFRTFVSECLLKANMKRLNFIALLAAHQTIGGHWKGGLTNNSVIRRPTRLQTVSLRCEPSAQAW
jgi:hypothetical protein